MRNKLKSTLTAIILNNLNILVTRSFLRKYQSKTIITITIGVESVQRMAIVRAQEFMMNYLELIYVNLKIWSRFLIY